MVLACTFGEIMIPLKILDTIHAGTGASSQILNVSPSDQVGHLFTQVANLYKYDPESFELILQNNTGDTTILNDYKSSTVGALPYTFRKEGTTLVTLNAISPKRGNATSKQHHHHQQQQQLPKIKRRQCSAGVKPPAPSDAQVAGGGGEGGSFGTRWAPCIVLGPSRGSAEVRRTETAGPGVVVFDDMSLGASASPTADDAPDADADDVENGEASTFREQDRDRDGAACSSRYFPPDKHYVGLVNQAMTCYLNSLLQALYNTPEFRNALYNWKFNGETPDKSIPYQLQRLFVSLQTSGRSAVETTDLTHSFGWGMQAAWEQHDIQELCRVMFDALEHTFRDTNQANLINDLYEGTLLDYVKCLECRREKSREDTFLDIPLPVRPFASTEAYNSVEEALRAFIQPETLDGNNQYHCESCDKKCDAHKGLKFIKLPYLLTLHLKRFDFDYSSMHRIKLNDKVVFREKLNLNSFVTSATNVLSEEALEERDGNAKCDDCSTTDYGSALDDESCQGTDLSSSAIYPFDSCQDDDEGIDVSSGNNCHENEKNRRLQEPQGPYLYELFSIMIHSGSASGGHYYAYIKDFDKDNWFCYNDTCVTGITEEDIRKTYGGGPSRTGGYYSGAYTSSTNAYMLMYRQVDPERNTRALSQEDFPEHIAELAMQIRVKEENDRRAREQETNLIRIKVSCYHPSISHAAQLAEARLQVTDDNTLAEIARDAHTRFELEACGIRPEDCRLVSYNRLQDLIQTSWPSADSAVFGELDTEGAGGGSGGNCGWLLEIRQPGKEWIAYNPGEVNIRVYVINIDTEEVEQQTVIRAKKTEKVENIRQHILNLYPHLETVDMVIKRNNSDPVYLALNDPYDQEDLDLDSSNMYKLYVSQYREIETGSLKRLKDSKLYSHIDKFQSLMSVLVLYPDTNLNMLNALTIPSLDLNQNFERLMETGGGGGGGVGGGGGGGAGDRTSPILRASPQLGVGANGTTGSAAAAAGSGAGAGVGAGATDAFGDHSNSEDSSLSDSDRTLVGDAPGDCMAMLSSNSNSMPDVHLSSPTPSDSNEDQATNQDMLNKTLYWDDNRCTFLPAEDEAYPKPPVEYYFKAEILPTLTDNAATNAAELTSPVIMRCCRIVADKKLSLRSFKQRLAPVIGVPVDYYKLFRQQQQQVGTSSSQSNENEWCNPLEHLETNGVECERLVVKLGRNLRDGEYAVSIHHLVIDGPEPSTPLFDWIVGNGQLVSVVKKDILQHAKKHHRLDIPYARARLRKKSYKNPLKVYLDHEKFGEDITLRSNSNQEIFLEALNEDETMSRSNQHLAIFLRRWSPATYHLGAVQQLTLSIAQQSLASTLPSLAAVREAVASLSGIPAGEVDLAHVRAAFPADINVAVVQLEQEWVGAGVDQELGVYEDGAMLFYRDHREEAKELTPEELTELFRKESVRLGICSNTSRNKGNLRREERALKIYLEPQSNTSSSSTAVVAVTTSSSSTTTTTITTSASAKDDSMNVD